MDTPTSVDCMSLREAGGFRRSSFGRSLLDCMIPACCTAGFQPFDSNISCDSSSSSGDSTDSPTTSIRDHQNVNYCSTSTTVTGTFFGHRKGHVSFCLQVQQQDESKRSSSSRRRSRTTSPVVLLLLEFGVPTSYLAREMQHGLLRIALVEQKGSRGSQHKNSSSSSSIFAVPMWTMYCNGRKVGFATRREMTDSDGAVLKLMQSVSVGAGVLPSQSQSSTSTDHDHEILYLRASFKRVTGSLDSESFHMINPDSDNPFNGSSSNSYTCATSSSGQELSIFLLRSSS